MAVVIELPKLSDTMEEGRLANWLKKEGDFVKEGEALVEIETDKATMEYPSPEEGTLLKILKPAGETMPLSTPIAVLGKAGEAFDLGALVKAPVPAAAKAPEKVVAPASAASAPAASTSGGRVKASPLAKKMAKDQGVDIASVPGSGPGGRVIAVDVSGFKPTTNVARPQGNRRIELSMMRKTIAKRLVSAKNDAPHFYLTVSAQMDAILRWREDLNRDPRVDAGKLPKVSVNDLVIMATAKALRLHPEVNAGWEGDSITQYGAVDVSMAVALPGGLVTPILFGADQLGARDIAHLTKTLGQRAKDNKLEPKEYVGGSFTISNLGMTGIESFTAIINPPQACILAVGAVKSVAHATDDGHLVAQRRMKMTLSCDHRVVDGMVGAMFLKTLVQHLETPMMMLA